MGLLNCQHQTVSSISRQIKPSIMFHLWRSGCRQPELPSLLSSQSRGRTSPSSRPLFVQRLMKLLKQHCGNNYVWDRGEKWIFQRRLWGSFGLKREIYMKRDGHDHRSEGLVNGNTGGGRERRRVIKVLWSPGGNDCNFFFLYGCNFENGDGGPEASQHLALRRRRETHRFSWRQRYLDSSVVFFFLVS